MNTKSLLLFLALFTYFNVSSQNANLAYAITGDGNNDYLWMNIRQVDLSTGKIVKTIYNHQTAKNKMRQGEQTVNNKPSQSLIAAAAFDTRTGRLYYAPMFESELRWFETKKINPESDIHFATHSLPVFAACSPDESGRVTRMVISSDGDGYALTNDAQHLLRFTTGNKPVFSDLGAIADDPSNTVSISAKASSWGGDMVADAFGKLYLITAGQHIFSIDVDTKTASHKGRISGLPDTYTTNAASVDAMGNLIVCSANQFGGYYKVNMKTLIAEKMEGSEARFNTSDLAGSNFLFQQEADEQKRLLSIQKTASGLNKKFAEISPNPITTNFFIVKFKNLAEAAPYDISITDLEGKSIQLERTSIPGGNSSYRINMLSRLNPGSYFVQIIQPKTKAVYVEKIVVQ